MHQNFDSFKKQSKQKEEKIFNKAFCCCRTKMLQSTQHKWQWQKRKVVALKCCPVSLSHMTLHSLTFTLFLKLKSHIHAHCFQSNDDVIDVVSEYLEAQ